MLCLLLNVTGDCMIVNGSPDIFVKERDFDRILKDVAVRKLLVNELQNNKIISTESVLVSSLGKQIEAEIYTDFDVKVIQCIEHETGKEFGIYEKL